jgi:site-specific DNA-cytosine methylase
LTPTECARLQGFADDWCEDVPHSDSAEYKLWGNGISLPVLLPMFKAMRKVFEKDG